MKKIVKKNYKIVIAFIIGLLISSVGVYALGSLSSSDISYNNDSSGIQANTMQGAIDELYEKTKTPNVDLSTLPNIISVYEYHEDLGNPDYCVSGDEETCKISNCYQIKENNSCEAGTVVNYKVNDSKIVRFHVLHDDGNTMTLQSQQNIVYNIAWFSETDNSNGPSTVLEMLEKETQNWKNVNILNYSIGDSNSTLKFSGCSALDICSSSPYHLEKSNVRARMITLQEATDLNCTGEWKSCPIWMYNYLSESKNYGGTQNSVQNGKYYYTLSAYSNDLFQAWHIYVYGSASYYDINDTSGAARAVVEINK